MTSHDLCPCHSGRPYPDCCQPYHNGKAAENALVLMRSRYSAYALHLAAYIIRTSIDHPLEKAILAFSQSTRFEGLEILAFVDGPQRATVTFRAILKQNGRDVSFTEISHFVKMNDCWFYQNGETSVG
jgi:SEC-C motif domain protein